MDCKEIEMKIMDYLEGNLDEKTRDNIDKHLATCNYCLDSLRESQEILKIMADTKLESPDKSLRIDFYNMLHDEISKNSQALNGLSGSVKPKKTIQRNIFYAAAGFALLICGTLIGMIISSVVSGNKNSQEIARLRSEVTSLKVNAVYSMLNRESSSERIQAVNYVDELPIQDKALIDVLINTLNTDKNVNVRMAAAYALEKYTDQQSVCDSLVQSLSHQTEPILQVSLINILVEQKVKSAQVPIRNIINNDKTNKEVRSVAENAIKTLI